MTLQYRSFLYWLFLGTLAMAVLSLAAAFAPPMAKRLLLFHAAYGVIGGFGLGWLAAELRVLRPVAEPDSLKSPASSTAEPEATSRRKLCPVWLVSLTGAAILLGGGIHIAKISSEQFRQTQQARARQNPEQAALLEMMAGMSQDDPELAARYEDERRKASPTFQDYLAHRVSGIGTWKEPWPFLFWAGELLLAAGLGGWMLFQRVGAG